MTITITDLANRFRNFNFDNPEPASHNIFYQNRNSVGNRYVNWKGVWAYKNYTGDETRLDQSRLYKEISGGKCDWRHLFEGIHYGLIIGPQTLDALEDCLTILCNDTPPEDDGKKVLHVNYLGGRNWITKPVFHDWELTSRLGKIMSTAFFADRSNQTLYSQDYTYIFKSHAGWSRST